MKARRLDSRQRVVQHGGVAAIHFADEAQGQVQLLARLPARAGHTALDQHDGLRHRRPEWPEPRTVSSRQPSQRQTAAEQQHHRAIADPGAEDRRGQRRHIRQMPLHHQRRRARAQPGAPAGGDAPPAATGGSARTNAVSMASSVWLLPDQVRIATLIQAPSAVPSATPATPRCRPQTKSTFNAILATMAVTVARAGVMRVVTGIEGGRHDPHQRHGRKPRAIGRQRQRGQRRGMGVERAMRRRPRA